MLRSDGTRARVIFHSLRSFSCLISRRLADATHGRALAKKHNEAKTRTLVTTPYLTKCESSGPRSAMDLKSALQTQIVMTPVGLALG